MNCLCLLPPKLSVKALYEPVWRGLLPYSVDWSYSLFGVACGAELVVFEIICTSKARARAIVGHVLGIV